MKTRKNILIIMTLCLLLIICSCNSVKEKVAEKAIEKAAEKATGAEIDIDKNNSTVQVGDETLKAGEELDWPKDFFYHLPEIDANITALLSDESTMECVINFNEYTKEQAEEYVETLLDLGYVSSFNGASEDTIMFTGTNESGGTVTFIYQFIDDEGTFGYIPGNN